MYVNELWLIITLFLQLKSWLSLLMWSPDVHEMLNLDSENNLCVSTDFNELLILGIFNKIQDKNARLYINFFSDILGTD